MKKQIYLLCALLVGVILAGCNNQQELESEPEIIVGYIYFEESELLVDEVELVTAEDIDRIEELQLKEHDYPSGYHLQNDAKKIVSFLLTDETKYIFTDVAQLYVDENVESRLYETKNQNEFIEGSSYQNIKLDDIELDRHYIPYFIEVIDGEVISITEKLMYTI